MSEDSLVAKKTIKDHDFHVFVLTAGLKSLYTWQECVQWVQ